MVQLQEVLFYYKNYNSTKSTPMEGLLKFYKSDQLVTTYYKTAFYSSTFYSNVSTSSVFPHILQDCILKQHILLKELQFFKILQCVSTHSVFPHTETSFYRSYYVSSVGTPLHVLQGIPCTSRTRILPERVFTFYRHHPGTSSSSTVYIDIQICT